MDIFECVLVWVDNIKDANKRGTDFVSWLFWSAGLTTLPDCTLQILLDKKTNKKDLT